MARPRWRESIRIDRPVSLRELGVALVVLGLVAALVLWPHLRHGGFYSDDWANAAGTLQPPGGPDVGKAISYFAGVTIFRPVLVLYVPLTYIIFGLHLHYQLAWAALLAVIAATMVYGVLRVLGVPWVHALLIGALTVVFPWSDSTRLWVTGDQLTLAITFAAAGLLIALVGLRRGQWRWHLCAAFLYLLSILTYEIALPLIACFGALYCLQVGWRAARSRWLIDLTMVVVGGVWVGSHTARTTSGISGDLTHLKQIVTAGGTILGRAGLAVGPSRTPLVLGAIATALGVGAFAYFRSSSRFTVEQGWGLRGWLALTVAGLVVAALGWVMFIPADPYYTPSIFGVTNRVNALAAFGLIIAIYGVLGIVGALIGQMLPRWSMAATGVSVSLALLLFASYAVVLRRHVGVWNAAFVAERSALIGMQKAIPTLPHGATVFTSSYPASQTLGVPIFADAWGLNGMVELEYDDQSLSAFPILPEQVVACPAGGVALRGPGAPKLTVPYGKAWLLDLQSLSHAVPRSRLQCRRIASSYGPGPLYLSSAY